MSSPPTFDARLLLPKLEGDKERVGLILHDGEIVELENICPEPETGFEIKGEDMLAYEDRILGTWHTHPNQVSNLSTNDYLSFLNWPELSHYIVGTDGVSRYFIQKNRVILCDVACSSTDP